MKLTSYYPVLCTARVAETAAFYTRHFGFTPAFEAEWYVHLAGPAGSGANLGIVDHAHPTIPDGYRRPVQGLLINFEVADVDAEYERARTAGLDIRLALRDEAFGQRHFIVADPNGVLIDVIKPIKPSAEFAAQYKPETLERLGIQ